MSRELCNLVQRISDVSMQDAANIILGSKTPDADPRSAAGFYACSEVLYASLVEEVGEFAKAVKLEDGIITHGKLYEPSSAEAVDIFICGVMLSAVASGGVDNLAMTLRVNPTKHQNRVLEQSEGRLIFGGITALARATGELGNEIMSWNRVYSMTSEGIPQISLEEITTQLGGDAMMGQEAHNALAAAAQQGPSRQQIGTWGNVIASLSMDLYMARNRSMDAFEDLVGNKLDKWESHLSSRTAAATGIVTVKGTPPPKDALIAANR
jgi:hypothetical protein